MLLGLFYTLGSGLTYQQDKRSKGDGKDGYHNESQRQEANDGE